MARPIVHFEIGCRNSEATQKFYKDMFEWDYTPAGLAAMIAPINGGIGGHINSLGHEPHNYTIFYVGVDDVAAYLEKAKAHGGKTIVGPITIPSGTFAWMQDPEGNTIGLWKAA